ncbi:uncharacterized protein LOC108411136 isoform X2 [Pygocentrus nattereri]|uniref:uncharacterized protein LOC108411136 isoform X2 n=1 Tax=Pygocentrus nattereri TaxID=42514 RepID=UPI0008142D17|nr:uncharacterized protein LOC108411136 isoform X2 [Pygocentrus nattereri]
MVRCGVLVGLVLLSMLSPGAWAQIANLPDIISFLQANYGGGGQFAVAINVPASKCASGVKPDQNFLPNDGAQKAKGDMAGPSRVYIGQQLIGAKPKPMPNNPKINYHSEYLLLIQYDPPTISPDDPLMKRLLDSNPTGCAIFYTLNSPCVNTCSTPNKPYSIIPALNIFQNHKGPKSFVFGQVWKHDVNTTQWEANMKEVNARVPLYRCDNAGCTLCVNNNNVIAARCKY